MKLVLQIAAGVLLAWLTVAALQWLLAYSALAEFSKALNSVPTMKSPAATQRATPAATQPPYLPPAITRPMNQEQLDAYIRADEARAQADHDATYGTSKAVSPPIIRKATPQDAAEKPAK